MSTPLWIIAAVAIVVVVGYLLVMRVFFRQSREVDKQIDYSKIRPIKDEDD
jgi:low affinity Fe/Cu permease